MRHLVKSGANHCSIIAWNQHAQSFIVLAVGVGLIASRRSVRLRLQRGSHDDGLATRAKRLDCVLDEAFLICWQDVLGYIKRKRCVVFAPRRAPRMMSRTLHSNFH